MSNYLLGHQRFARSRIVTNQGDIIEGSVSLRPAGKLMGVPMSEPPTTIPFGGYGSIRFDHLTTDGVAVYLEE